MSIYLTGWKYLYSKSNQLIFLTRFIHDFFGTMTKEQIGDQEQLLWLCKYSYGKKIP